MPEGDTIFKLAGYLGPHLTGRRIIAGMARTTHPVDLAGSRIGKVFAEGKHLFIALDQDRLLRSHLGMWGSWHGYAPHEPWRKPRRQGSIILNTGERVFVCFNAAQVEVLRSRGVRRRVLDVALGPDLLADPVEYRMIVSRAWGLVAGETPILDVLLDQRIACGIGNVYKSELLFLAGVHPECPLKNLTEDDLLRIYRLASRLMRANIQGGPRVTRQARDQAGKLWVYGRRGRPCLRCDAVIRSAKLGLGLRSTYWCPNCQSPEFAKN